MSDNRIVSLRAISTGDMSRDARGDEAGFGSDRGAAIGGLASVEAQGLAVGGRAARWGNVNRCRACKKANALK